MSRDDPRAQALIAGYRDEHAMAPDHGAAIWTRIEHSIADGATGPSVAAARPSSGGAQSVRTGWLLAFAAAAGAVLALSITARLAGHDEARPPMSESLDRSERAAADDAIEATPTHEPSRATPTPAEPPAVRPRAEPTVPSSEPTRPGSRARRPVATPARTVDEADALVVELGLVRRARRALQDGDATTALALLDAHARAFEHGQMVEDRLALRVEAFCATGAERQARTEATRLRRSFPRSAHAFDVATPCRKNGAER